MNHPWDESRLRGPLALLSSSSVPLYPVPTSLYKTEHPTIAVYPAPQRAVGKNYGLGRRGDFFGKGQTNFVNLLRAYMCFIDDMYSFVKDDLYICPKEIRIGKL